MLDFLLEISGEILEANIDEQIHIVQSVAKRLAFEKAPNYQK